MKGEREGGRWREGGRQTDRERKSILVEQTFPTVGSTCHYFL